MVSQRFRQLFYDNFLPQKVLPLNARQYTFRGCALSRCSAKFDARRSDCKIFFHTKTVKARVHRRTRAHNNTLRGSRRKEGDMRYQLAGDVQRHVRCPHVKPTHRKQPSPKGKHSKAQTKCAIAFDGNDHSTTAKERADSNAQPTYWRQRCECSRASFDTRRTHARLCIHYTHQHIARNFRLQTRFTVFVLHCTRHDG